MYRIIILLIIMASLSFAGKFTAIRVSDGDTFIASGYDIKIKVRLVAIDTPEMGSRKKPAQPFAKEAKEYLLNKILNKEVNILGYGMGGFNRTLGEVYIGSLNLNLELVKLGLAEVYRGRPPKGIDIEMYKKAEAIAKKNKVGMWSLDNPISPKKWRKLKFKKK